MCISLRSRQYSETQRTYLSARIKYITNKHIEFIPHCSAYFLYFSMYCGLCCEPFEPQGDRSPIVLSCAHTYCRGCFGQWTHTASMDGAECPHCKKAVSPVLCNLAGPTFNCRRHGAVGEVWCSCCSTAYCRNCSRGDFQRDAASCSGHHETPIFADVIHAWNARLKAVVEHLRRTDGPLRTPSTAMDTDDQMDPKYDCSQKHQLCPAFNVYDNGCMLVTLPSATPQFCARRRLNRELWDEQWREMSPAGKRRKPSIL
eukprot:GEMP01077742.1.p1 GENE.GEMP01077742.1~~GEMP01077742.1.p1  ORF type:complete len:258 (+),score=26.01 GEMP01077742.1:214-987(+)